MSFRQRRQRVLERIFRWLGGQPDRLDLPVLQDERHERTRYPDYVTCPHCAEPEVEVWDTGEAACCHNCGQSIAFSEPGFFLGGRGVTRR